MKRSGFTLMEMLVVLALFAMIGLISSQLLYQTAELSMKMVGRSDYITDMHRAMSVLDRDIRQIVNRGIRDEIGELMDPLTLDDSRLLQFSRMGWLNPMNESRGTVQRVEYSIDEGILQRRYWHVLDRDQESTPVIQTVMQGVEMQFVLIDSNGETLTTYPELLDVEELVPELGDPSSELDEEEARPVALQLQFSLPDIGSVERIWMIPNVPTIPEPVSEELEGDGPQGSGS